LGERAIGAMSRIQLEDSWLQVLESEFEQDYMKQLKAFLQQEKAQGKQILPASDQWFAALNATSFDLVKVVIIGQDPYPTPGHAHGLCFSVQPQVRPLPKSLINIYQELVDDLGVRNQSGYLMPWAEQGVLLINAVLTVETGNANSHQGKGWERFTDAVIQGLNQRETHCVFVLWGAYAQKKGVLIDEQRHTVIRSAHPSPLSAYRGFFGSKPFSKINSALVSQQQTPIDWQLPE
jgi:uracil-DNA glycosylase